MVMSGTCSFIKEDGQPCRAAPVRGSDFCFWHSPEHTREATEARRLGGLRRRREKITSNVYQFEGLGSVVQIRRLLEIAVLDTLGLENSVARARTIAYLCQVSVKLLETGELEDRVEMLEQTLNARPATTKRSGRNR